MKDIERIEAKLDALIKALGYKIKVETVCDEKPISREEGELMIMQYSNGGLRRASSLSTDFYSLKVDENQEYVRAGDEGYIRLTNAPRAIVTLEYGKPEKSVNGFNAWKSHDITIQENDIITSSDGTSWKCVKPEG